MMPKSTVIKLFYLGLSHRRVCNVHLSLLTKAIANTLSESIKYSTAVPGKVTQWYLHLEPNTQGIEAHMQSFGGPRSGLG